jgi:hypothetical protein
MINGNEYSWEDINVILPGSLVPADGVTAIEYSEKKDHQNIYGRGAKPVAAGRGKVEFSGSITLLQSTVEAMQKGLPKGKSITSIAPFDITVGYLPDGGVATVDTLKYCRFGEIKKGMKTGDPNMEIQIPLIIGDILYDV